jgi:hypothetical protein
VAMRYTALNGIVIASKWRSEWLTEVDCVECRVGELDARGSPTGYPFRLEE